MLAVVRLYILEARRARAEHLRFLAGQDQDAGGAETYAPLSRGYSVPVTLTQAVLLAYRCLSANVIAAIILNIPNTFSFASSLVPSSFGSGVSSCTVCGAKGDDCFSKNDKRVLR